MHFRSYNSIFLVIYLMYLSLGIRRAIVVIFLSTLLIFGRWRIVLLMMVVSLILTMDIFRQETCGGMPDIMEDISGYIRLLPERDQRYYFARFRSLERLTPDYPASKIAVEKLRTFNQLLYSLPLTDEDEDNVLSIKNRILGE